MEDFRLNIVVGKGPCARTMKLSVKPFTMVGATTRWGLLSSPLRDRFGQHYHLDFHTHADLAEIVRCAAALLNVASTKLARPSSRRARAGRRESRTGCCAACAISRRSMRRRSLPARSPWPPWNCSKSIRLGSTRWTARFSAIIDKFYGGPVGVESLAAAVGEECETIEEVYEPYLLQEGFLARTSRGRVATQRAYTHLGRIRRGTLL